MYLRRYLVVTWLGDMAHENSKQQQPWSNYDVWGEILAFSSFLTCFLQAVLWYKPYPVIIAWKHRRLKTKVCVYTYMVSNKTRSKQVKFPLVVLAS